MSAAVKQFKHQQTTDNAVINNLHRLMQHQGLSEAELARQTGVPQPTLHKILSNQTTDPRISTLKTLADFFKIPLDDLFSDNVLLQDTPTSGAKDSQSIPVISWEDCVKPNPTSDLSPTNWEDWLVLDGANTIKHGYALISRPSMEPHFPRGTTLIVDPDVRPSDGDLIVVQYPDTESATLRELIIDGPNRMLIPLNQNSDADHLTDTTRVLGTVTQYRYSY
jgi:SOS-response transcriptional repressor LexA